MIKFKQYFETELFLKDGLSFRSITIPSRNFDEPWLFSKPHEISHMLGIEITRKYDRKDISEALHDVIVGGYKNYYSSEFDDHLYDEFLENIDEFVEYLVCEPSIPFENSPLSAESFMSLLTKSGNSGVDICVFIGFSIADPLSPYLFIAVPAGIIICGVAIDIRKKLKKDIHELEVQKLLKVVRKKIKAWQPRKRR